MVVFAPSDFEYGVMRYGGVDGGVIVRGYLSQRVSFSDSSAGVDAKVLAKLSELSLYVVFNNEALTCRSNNLV